MNIYAWFSGYRLECFIFFFLLINNIIFGQTIGDYRTAQSAVSWQTANHWQVWDGSNWISPGALPGLTNNIYIQASHTVTLSGDAHCNNLYISTGTTNATTGGDAQLALITYSLSINGKLSCYYGAVNIIINSAVALSVTASNTIPSSPITKTSNSNTGRIKFVGNTRSIFVSGEWSSGNSGATTTYDLAIDLNPGQTATMEVNVKAYNWIINSGTLDAGTNLISSDNGVAGLGDVSINNGGTLISARSSNSNPVFARTGSTACGQIIVNTGGILELNGLNPKIDAVTITFSGTVKYNRAGAQTFVLKGNAIGSVDPGVYNNIILSNSGAKSLGLNSVCNGTLSVRGTASLISGLYTLVYGSSSTLEYKGSGLQTVASNPNEWPVINGPVNITIYNSSGVILGTSRTISGTLSLISGILTSSGSNIITLAATGNVTGASDSSFVNGPFRKIGNTSFIFPIGKVDTSQSFSGYQAIGISAPLNIYDTFSAEYMRVSPYTLGYMMSGLYKVSGCEFWKLNSSTGSNIEVSLYAHSNSGCNGSSGNNYFGAGPTYSNIRVSSFNDSSARWEIAGSGASYSGSSPDLVFNASGVNSYGQFTFGTISGISALPVNIISFTAEKRIYSNELNWVTAMEKNNAQFDIERSADGITFHKIGEVKGYGTTLNISEYSFTDQSLETEKNKTFFYRLKQIDFSGRFEFSKIIKVSFENKTEEPLFRVHPNPFENSLSINYISHIIGDLKIIITDATGHIILENHKSILKGELVMNFNTSAYPPGLYFIRLEYNGFQTHHKMAIKL